MSLINPPPSQETFVYHYTTREIALRYILPAGSFRFNPLILVNDPREANNWEPVVSVDRGTPMDLSDWKTLERSVSNALRSGIKL